MYRKILVALENSRADESIMPHVTELAKLCQARLLLVHVADGWVARHYDDMQLAESEEMKSDRAYLEKTAVEARGAGLMVDTLLALGNPPNEILKTAETELCDLIAMTAHGHRLLGDLIHGSTINVVRHNTTIPILIVRAANK